MCDGLPPSPFLASRGATSSAADAFVCPASLGRAIAFDAKLPSSRPEPSTARRSGGTYSSCSADKKEVPRLRGPLGRFARDDGISDHMGLPYIARELHDTPLDRLTGRSVM